MEFGAIQSEAARFLYGQEIQRNRKENVFGKIFDYTEKKVPTEAEETSAYNVNMSEHNVAADYAKGAFYRSIAEKSVEYSDDGNNPEKVISRYVEQTYEKIKNGDAEPSIQIGNCSFTEKEWNELLEKVDAAQEALRKSADEELKSRIKNKETQEAAEKSDSVQDIDDILTSELTICTYPADKAEKEDIMYITFYTEDGIFCKKAGQTDGYEWTVKFDGNGEYNKVMQFLNKFSSSDNLVFASHENFWQDFLNDKINIDEFEKFFGEVKNATADYTFTVGEAVYIDKDKLNWTQYMNLPESDFYTAVDFWKLQSEIIGKNESGKGETRI